MKNVGLNMYRSRFIRKRKGFKKVLGLVMNGKSPEEIYEDGLCSSLDMFMYNYVMRNDVFMSTLLNKYMVDKNLLTMAKEHDVSHESLRVKLDQSDKVSRLESLVWRDKRDISKYLDGEYRVRGTLNIEF